MRFRPDKNQIKWGITAFIVIALSILFYFFVFYGGRFVGGLLGILRALSAVIYGVILGYILTPVLNFIEEKILFPLFSSKDKSNPMSVKRRSNIRKAAVPLTLILFLLLLFGTVMIIVPQLIASIQSIAASMPTYINNVNEFITVHLADINEEASNYINQVINQIYEGIDNFINTKLLPSMTSVVTAVSKSALRAIQTIFNLFIGLIVSGYILYSKDTFAAQGKKMAYAFLKEDTANKAIAECRFIHQTFTNFFVGKIVDSIIIGFLCFIGTSIIGTPYPVLVSFIIGVTNIIPVFGPYIGAAIGAILVFMIQPLASLYFLIFVLILQQFDGNILGPRILGSSTGLPSFWVMFAIFLFGGVFGLPGWVIGVPLFAVIYRTIARAVNRRLSEKSMDTDTNAYIETAYVEEGKMVNKRDVTDNRFNAGKAESAWKRILGIRNRRKNNSDKA
ncbi:MAG: AI-2E family transporter [Lachnospiraceae bacterium]|nr:AI-2E family transporter [Lachnospiraceae bacterium]